jgi:outer membrane protein
VARARLQRAQAQIRIRDLELRIVTEVRDAGRRVDMNSKRIDATKAACQLAERRLESEEKRFAAGLSTSFLVFQAQRDLAQARNAELRATFDYNTSVVEFEVIQEAPASAGSPSLTGTVARVQ